MFDPISLEREVLRRLVNRYFESDSQACAYRQLVSRAAIGNPALAAEYVAEHERLTAQQLEATEGLRSCLADAFVAKDDAQIREILHAQFQRE